MTGRIKDGRQEPEPGSKRAAAMAMVKAYVQAHHHPTSKSKHAIAAALGMSIQRVQGALLDLDTFDPSFKRAIPAPANDNKVSPGWNTQSRQGEASQARHNSTRLARQATRLEKNIDAENDPAVAALMSIVVNQERTTSDAIRQVGEVLKNRA
jgi:hypothetical protein